MPHDVSTVRAHLNAGFDEPCIASSKVDTWAKQHQI